MVEELYISTTTVGQLYNFLNVVASVIVFINCFFDMDYRIKKMQQFEDNIGIVSDMMSCIAAFVVAYYSLNTPFDLVEVTTRATENFRTVAYMLSLHIASQAAVVDNPSLLFSTAYDAIGDATGGTILDTGELTYIRATPKAFVKNINKYCLEAIYISKYWLAIAALVYSVYVVRANQPSFNRKCRLFFQKTFLGRIPTIAISAYGMFLYFVNIDLTTTQRYATVLYEDQQVTDRQVAATVFESMSILVLAVKALYILLFWRRYELAIPAALFIIVKAIDRQDELQNDSETFDTLVYAAIIAASLAVGPIVVFLGKINVRTTINVGPNILYKLGFLLVIMSGFFLVPAVASEWFDFDFEQGNIATDAASKINTAVGKIDGIVGNIFDVARQLDPCVRRKDLPDKVPTDSGQYSPISNINQVDQQLLENRIRLADDVDDIGSICIDASTSNYDWDLSHTDSTQQLHCQKLKDDEDRSREELEDNVNNDNFDQNEGYAGNEENDYFVSASCRNKQCNAMTGVAAAALVVSNIPFTGPLGLFMNLGGRAAFTIFKVGRKIAKFGPRLKRKKDKVDKLAKKIGKAIGTINRALAFTVGMTSIFLPIFIGAVVTLALVMFRRDIFVERSGKGGNYQAVRTQSIDKGLGITLAIFGPLCIIDALFAAMLYILPMFMAEMFSLLPASLVIATFEELPGYTSLKMAYLVGCLGNALVVISGLLFVFNNSIASIFFSIRTSISSFYYFGWNERKANLKMSTLR